jgi:threonine dehydrogenase-like Zn-dependent dehydrogenase
MRALTWQENEHVEVIDVPDPAIQEPNDIVIRVTSTAICGSDLCIDDLLPIVSDGSDPLGVLQFATHHLPLEDAPRGYEMFRDKADGCIKVVLQP